MSIKGKSLVHTVTIKLINGVIHMKGVSKELAEELRAALKKYKKKKKVVSRSN